MPIVFAHRVTNRTIFNVLLSGFSLVLALLLAAGSMAVQNGREIVSHAETLIREQVLAARLTDEIRREQAVLNSVLLQLAHEPDSVDAELLMRQLQEADAAIAQIASTAKDRPKAALWQELAASAKSFSAEARQLLMAPGKFGSESLRPLIRHQQQVVELAGRLSEASSQRALSADNAITTNAGDLMQESVLLLGACVVLALLGSVLTIRTVAHLFREMQQSASELNRVSWQMLKGQEDSARRFSHELHDELGQGLTALRANIEALAPANDIHRSADALKLVDDCINNVRELSQLLRPVILDDFGLAASLQWLGENFSRRTGIAVNCRLEFSGRLYEEVETHLFRVAQEALTNVARHSGATEADIELTRSSDRVTLAISDNGRGLQSKKPGGGPSLGIVGMRARARYTGGDFFIANRKSGGLTVTIWAPISQHAEQEN